MQQPWLSPVTRKIFLVLPLAVLLTGVPSLAQTPTGSVQGVLLDDTGRPFSGADVHARVAVPQPPNLPPVTPVLTHGAVASARTARDGTFALSRVAAGTYAICARPNASGLLDSCNWSRSLPVVAVAAGQTVGGVQIRLEKGSVLQVILTDPRRVLDPPAGSRTEPLVHLALAGLRGPVFLARGPGQSRVYEATIPYDFGVRLGVGSGTVQLTNEAGVTIAPGSVSIPVLHASGAGNPGPIVINVVGLAR